MSWSKRQLISEAYGELALQGYAFDITPEEQQTALRRMDTMMATWEARGVRCGYAMSGGTDLDADSGLPEAAVETVYLNLAIRLAAGIGKTLTPVTIVTARQGYDALLWQAARPQQQQFPDTLPRGAGNKPWRGAGQPFMPTPSDSPLGITQGGDLDIFPE